MDILWPRWVARIGVTRATEACFLTADRQCTELPLLRRQGRWLGEGRRRKTYKDAAATLRALHELAGAAPEEAVPDGAVPAALPRFLRLVGIAEAEMAGALLGIPFVSTFSVDHPPSREQAPCPERPEKKERKQTTQTRDRGGGQGPHLHEQDFEGGFLRVFSLFAQSGAKICAAAKSRASLPSKPFQLPDMAQDAFAQVR